MGSMPDAPSRPARGPIDFEEFTRLLEEMVAEIPPRFLEGVSAIHAIPESKPDRELPDVFLLGEYHQRQDGKFVYLYHGSFLAMGWRSRRRFEEEMRDTLLHELRHHWEEAAHLPDLRDEDHERLHRFRHRGGSKRRTGPSVSPWQALAGLVARPLFFLVAVLAGVLGIGWLLGP